VLKLIIAGAAAFLVGIGAGTGVVVMRAPAPVRQAAAADSAAAGTAARAEQPAKQTPAAAKTDSATTPGQGPPAAAPGPVGAVAGSSATPTAAGAQGATATGPAQPPGHPVLPSAIPTGAIAVSASSESYGHLARILSNMKPSDAAKILAFLTDDQVEGILRTVGVRQAASLFAQLPAERAAAMSRRLIKNPPENAP
jgi:hypothetical protein